MSTDRGSTWFAAMTKPGAEWDADFELKLLGFETFLPFERVRQRRKVPNRPQHIVVEVEKPLYSRYLFVALQPGQSLYAVNTAAAVSTVVHMAGEPLRIPDAAITALMERCDEEGMFRYRDAVRRPRIEPGAAVRFAADSPLYGLVAQVAEDLGKSVLVVMEMFGAPMEVQVPPELLEVLPKACPGAEMIGGQRTQRTEPSGAARV